MNFQALAWWNIWPLALLGRPAPEKKRNNPLQRLEALCILNAKLRVPVKIKPVKNLRVPSFIIPI